MSYTPFVLPSKAPLPRRNFLVQCKKSYPLTSTLFEMHQLVPNFDHPKLNFVNKTLNERHFIAVERFFGGALIG
jgi:hypothetical protein